MALVYLRGAGPGQHQHHWILKPEPPGSSQGRSLAAAAGPLQHLRF